MIRKNPPIRPYPGILRRNLIRSHLIPLLPSLHQLLIRHNPPLHLGPPTRTQLERGSPNLFVPKHTTLPHPILLSILVLVHTLLDPLTRERGVAWGIIVEGFSVYTAKHEHVETTVGVGSRRGDGNDVLELVVVYHESVWWTVFFVEALVDSTGSVFAMV